LRDDYQNAQEYNKLRTKFISEIEISKIELANNKDSSKERLAGLKESIHFFKNLPKAMKSMDIQDKFEILSSIFPEKLQFDGKNCRTQKINKVLDLILTVDRGFRDNKKRDKLKKIGLSLWVEATDKISNPLIQDIHILSDLAQHLCKCI
jgi:site-specific DNA recombinase